MSSDDFKWRELAPRAGSTVKRVAVASKTRYAYVDDKGLHLSVLLLYCFVIFLLSYVRVCVWY